MWLAVGMVGVLTFVNLIVSAPAWIHIANGYVNWVITRPTSVSAVAHTISVVVAIVVGLLAIVFTWRYNERSIRRSARQDHIRMLMDVDQRIIQNEGMSYIFDSVRDAKTQEPRTPSSPPLYNVDDPVERKRRQALIYMVINMFDAVFDFDQSLTLSNFTWHHGADKSYRKAWENYIRQFFRDSTEAKSLLDKLLSDLSSQHRASQIYTPNFLRWLARCCR
jgi:hypothetical protein